MHIFTSRSFTDTGDSFGSPLEGRLTNTRFCSTQESEQREWTAQGEWKEEFLFWHINCLELRAVFLALKYFLPVLGEHHVIVRTDNMAVVSHINRQGGSRSRTLDRLARHLLLWSQDKFLSLRAVHVPGVLNLAADFLSRQKLKPGEWMLNRQTVSQIWDLFGKAEVDLFASQESSQCPLWFSLNFPTTLGIEAFACPSPSHSPILALPDLVLGANSPLVSTSMGDSDQAGLTVPASGQDLASSAGALEVVGMAHTGPRAVIDGLPAEVQETIASARAPATRKLYSSKWGVFESWCLTRAIDPVKCPVGPVLEFLQERLTAGAAATTLRVYVAAIAAQRELDEIPLGRHRLVSAFMRGARRLRPVRPTAVPSWDLSVVLEGLVTAPFEPLESASDRILTLKVVLLLALTSLKRVGDLQAFSVSETCMDFAPGLVKVTLRPRPGYIPKVLSTSFRSQVVTSLFPSPSLCFKWGWETPHALPGQGIEAICGSLQGLEKISPVIDLFWCWSPRACHVKAEDFSLGERRYFAGLWGAGTPFTS